MQHASSTESSRGAARAATRFHSVSTRTPVHRRDLCGGNVTYSSELHTALESFQLAAADAARAHADAEARNSVELTRGDDHGAYHKAALPAVLGRVTSTARTLHCALTAPSGAVTEEGAACWMDGAAGVPAAVFHAVLDELLAPREVATTGEVCVEGNDAATQTFLCVLCRLNAACLCADEANLGGPLLTVDSLSPSMMSARFAMGRSLDLLLWAVDYACRDQAEGARAHTAAAAGSDEDDGAHPCDSPWLSLLRRTDALLGFLHAALTPATAASELYACGVAARLGALQVLERLLAASYADHHGPHASGLPTKGGGDRSSERLEPSAALAAQLTADDLLCAVAAQLQASIPVLEEIHPASGFSHTLLYDCLRHGSALARTTAAVANGGVSGGAATRQSGAPYVAAGGGGKGLLDGTQQAQSPLELYNCAMTFLRHAVEYRTVTSGRMCAGNSGSGPAALPLPAWVAVVSVLERALLKGESALADPVAEAARPGDAAGTALSSTDPALPGATAAAAAAAASATADPAASASATPPPLTTAGVFTGAHQPYSTDPTPCGSPVLNPNPSAAAGAAANVTAQPAATSGESVTGAPQACNGGGAGFHALEFPHAPPLVPDEACSNPDDADSGHHRGRGTDRCSAMLERSVPSADATFNGMTDAETASALGDAATSLARTRSAAVARSTTNTHTISIATATAAASAAAGGTAATGGGEVTSAPSLSEAVDAPVRVSSVAATIATPLPAASGPLSTGHASCQPQHQQKHHTHQHHYHQHRVPSSAATASPAAPQALSVCSKGSLYVPRPRTSTSGGAASPSAAAAATPAAPTLASSATLLRWRHPSHPRLTSDALALLTDLTSASARTLTSMTTLVDADVLGVLRGMLECPSFALQQRVLAILESVFAFWETLTAQSLETLVLPDSTSSYSSAAAPVVTAAVLFREPHDAPFGSWPAGGVPQATGATLSALATPSIQPPSSPCVPAALRVFLQAFTTFLGWDAEGWEVTHANYTRRALQMLMHVLQHAKAGPSNSSSVGAAARRRPPRTTQALLHIVTFLLENGVIAHIWRCLATDATQIPGLLCGAASPPSPSSSGSSSGSSSSRVVSGAGRYTAPMWGYSSFLFGAPATLSLAILSDAQCTAMELLGALAEAVNWAAVGSVEANSWRPTAAAAAAAAVVPSVGTYMAFTEALFTHLTACANCLRRCTYTRSSSRPATPAELKALSRLLLTLRVLFASMGAGVGSRAAASTAAADRRETWRQCITDSRVLNVLASVGTAAELVGCSLPRLCMFTLRTFLDHAIVLAPPSPLLRLLPPREAAAEVALHALVRQPTPQPPVAGTTTVWGGSAVRESLLVTLLSRMQRRCAGQSAEVSLPLRLEVLALLVDIVTEAVAATQHAAVLGSTASFAGAAATVAAGIPLRDAVERAAEAIRMTQRFVANIIDCRVWSGTAQELRYLGPDNTALVKETLRFLCATTQLVGATGQLWTTTSAVAAAAALAYATDTCARGTDEGGCTSVGSDGAAARPYTLGQLMATTLVAESASLVFGFHIVTMDFPLTLAGLVNGTRWQSTTPKPTSTAAATGAAAAAVTGNRGAQSGRSAGPTSTSSATSSSRPTSPSSGVVVRMIPCPQPLAQQAPAAAIHEFTDEDRRETFQVAACALAELLRCLRCLQLLVLSAPVSPALTASASNAIAAAAAAPGSTPSLQWRPSGSASASPAIAGGSGPALLLPPSYVHDGTPAVGGAARWRSIAAAAVAATMASAVPERRGEVAPVNGSGLGGGHGGEPSHHQLQQHDVVLVSGPSGSTAGIVTTTMYRGVVGREGGTATQVAAALAVDGATVASTPGAPSSPASASSPASGTPSGPGGAEREEENANNCRQCEPRWRRRAVCFKTAHTDAVHALELGMLDRFLVVQARHDSTKEPHPARATSVVSSAGAAAAATVPAPATAAMTLLGGEEGEAAVLSRDNELECAITAVRFLASEKKRLHNSL